MNSWDFVRWQWQHDFASAPGFVVFVLASYVIGQIAIWVAIAQSWRSQDMSAELIDALSELESLLLRYRVSYVRVIRDVSSEVSASKPDKAKVIVREGLFRGTMGSLTDLYISRKNGNEVDDEKTANLELDDLVHRLWTLSE